MQKNPSRRLLESKIRKEDLAIIDKMKPRQRLEMEVLYAGIKTTYEFNDYDIDAKITYMDKMTEYYRKNNIKYDSFVPIPTVYTKLNKEQIYDLVKNRQVVRMDKIRDIRTYDGRGGITLLNEDQARNI